MNSVTWLFYYLKKEMCKNKYKFTHVLIYTIQILKNIFIYILDLIYFKLKHIF